MAVLRNDENYSKEMLISFIAVIKAFYNVGEMIRFAIKE